MRLGGVFIPLISVVVPCLLVILVAAGVFSLATGGRSDVGFAEIFTSNTVSSHVFLDIRIPRSLTAILIGVNLSIAGLILQVITRNSLASPSILGINQGAAFGLALALVFPNVIFGPNLMCMFGAIGAGFLTFAVAGGLSGRIESARLLLGGIAVGAFSYAIIRFTFTLEDEISRSVVHWVIGDISNMHWPGVKALLLCTIIGFVGAILLSKRLSLVSLGEETAQSLGTNPKVTLILGGVVAAILTGSSVCAAGPIAFVGLIVPRFCRLIFSGDIRILIPLCSVSGATLLLISDGLSKTLILSSQGLIGLVCAFIGAPLFLWLVIFKKEI